MSTPHVIRKYPKVGPQLVEAFRALPAATVYEAAGQRGMVSPAIRPVYPEAKLCGPALTVKCHIGDNLMIHKAVSIAQPGDVLVISIGNDVQSGAWGEILTTAAQSRGVAGVVIDGAVRDAEATLRRRFPIFSRGLAVGATMKRNLGLINHPLVCGNMYVEPGDLIIGDIDGVVVVPRERCAEVLRASQEREERERVLMEKIAKGATTLELLKLDPILAELGLTEE
jgi:4-hydroxy-4-methyl-2-oxoglutarate aldolase